MQTIVVDYLRICLFLVECPPYKNLTDAERKYGYGTTSGQKCDQELSGWHRFQGDAGSKMMTKCPLVNNCGTSFSAWLNDDHPTVAPGSVLKTVCISRKSTKSGGNCCHDKFLIKVKNCGSYFIYKLAPCQGTCPFRYCGTD